MKVLKKLPHTIYWLLLAMVIVGKISNYFFHYSDETNKLIDALMYVFIGIYYIIASFGLDNRIFKIIYILCGIYVIVMNFMDFKHNSLVGLICILIPWAIGWFFIKDDEDEDDEE